MNLIPQITTTNPNTGIVPPWLITVSHRNPGIVPPQLQLAQAQRTQAGDAVALLQR